MTTRQARMFAIASTAIAALVFLILTVHSHTRFPALTNAEAITPAVVAGKDVWHRYNCINCHTLFGEGAYYAPDLTKIAQLRGDAYLTAYMRDPAQFYDERTHRRLMPRQNLSDQEIADLIAFLSWASNVDTQGWPPRPILVATGLAAPGAAEQPGVTAVPTRPVSPEDDPIAAGENVFKNATPACLACHSTTPGVNLAGPSLAGIASRAEELIASGEYTGEAEDAAGYIRESIVAPSAHIIPGAMYSAGGMSFMPATYAESLSDEEIDQLVAYLMSFR